MYDSSKVCVEPDVGGKCQVTRSPFLRRTSTWPAAVPGGIRTPSIEALTNSTPSVRRVGMVRKTSRKVPSTKVNTTVSVTLSAPPFWISTRASNRPARYSFAAAGMAVRQRRTVRQVRSMGASYGILFSKSQVLEAAGEALFLGGVMTGGRL